STVIGAAPVNGSGVATLAISEVTLGAGVPHAITAVYSGDAAFDGDTKSFDLTVTQGAPTVAASSVTVTQGTSATFPVTVSSSATAKPTGTVTIMEGSSQLASGTLTNGAVTIAVATGALSVGAHTLTITYGGDDNFATAGVGVTLTVEPAASSGPVASTVSAPDTTVVYSQGSATVHVKVTASGVVPSGAVTVREGDTVLASGTLWADGTAAIALPAKSLKRGTYRLTAVYAGDARVRSGSTTFTLTVTNPAGH
ncbi:MAG: Ig-like domain-containing protein, partial [Actinomycetes bacterium]